MAELSQIATLHQVISNMLPTLAEGLSHRKYTQHVNLLEIVCKRVCIAINVPRFIRVLNIMCDWHFLYLHYIY